MPELWSHKWWLAVAVFGLLSLWDIIKNLLSAFLYPRLSKSYRATLNAWAEEKDLDYKLMVISEEHLRLRQEITATLYRTAVPSFLLAILGVIFLSTTKPPYRIIDWLWFAYAVVGGLLGVFAFIMAARYAERIVKAMKERRDRELRALMKNHPKWDTDTTSYE